MSESCLVIEIIIMLVIIRDLIKIICYENLRNGVLCVFFHICSFLEYLIWGGCQGVV